MRENVGCLCAWLVFFFYSFAVLCAASRGMGSSFATHSLLKLSRALWYFPRYAPYITVLFDLVMKTLKIYLEFSSLFAVKFQWYGSKFSIFSLLKKVHVDFS